MHGGGAIDHATLSILVTFSSLYVLMRCDEDDVDCRVVVRFPRGGVGLCQQFGEIRVVFSLLTPTGWSNSSSHHCLLQAEEGLACPRAQTRGCV